MQLLDGPPLVFNLALQGGGSHGAFTWGVLDALLEDGRVLAIAGGNDGTSNNRSAEIYNPATRSWSPTGRSRSK